jgi:hypothetical protein
MKDAQKVLSSLAVFIAQARRDEAHHVTDPLRSLAADIELIEENGIYHMLCSLQMGSLHHDLPWDPNVASGVLLLGCRSFDHHAPVDNRNYMVFWVLENLLDRITPNHRGKRLALQTIMGRPMTLPTELNRATNIATTVRGVKANGKYI